MKSRLRRNLLIFAAVVLLILCVTLGGDKAGEISKKEKLPTNAKAAGVNSSDGIIETDGLSVYGDVTYAISEETATGTDAFSEEPDVIEAELPEEVDEVTKTVREMSVEDKVAQLFIVTPEKLTKTDGVTMAGEATEKAIKETPVGGIIYMGDNLQAKTQVKEMLSNTNRYSIERVGLPMFLCVDEEGGTVARVAGSGRFDVSNVGDMADIGASGTVEDARQAGTTIGTYLSELGFNVDFAPVADVLTNPDNSIVKRRSFGSDSAVVSDMSIAVAEGLKSKGLEAVYKHFPGHGSTAGDTHLGAAFTNKSVDELSESELIPFQKAIDDGANFIMVSHISAPGITGHDTTASVSDLLITDVRRGKMGYNGIVVTDAMDMGAISQKYNSDEAACLAIKAGADMILMPADFEAAYNGVLNAVKSGEISEERLDESVTRIVKVKNNISDSGYPSR